MNIPRVNSGAHWYNTPMDPGLENVIRQTLGVAKAASRDHPNQAVDLHTLIEEPEFMNNSDRGLKHVCPECATKYFLLIRDTPPVGMYVLNMFCMRGSRLWGSRLHRACVV